MQAVREKSGLRVDYTPGGAVDAGDVVVLSNMVGIAELDIAASALGALSIVGVFRVVKANEAFATVGAKVFWDEDGNPYLGTGGSGAATATVETNVFLGFVVEAAADTDTTVLVLLTQSAAAELATGLGDLADTGTPDYTAGDIMVADGNSYEHVALSGDATLAANGALTLASQPLTKVITDVASAAAIPVTGSGHVALVTEGGAETRTLAAPDAVGLQLLLYLKTDAGDCVVTCATTVNETGNNTITFANTGEAVLLVAVEEGATLRWRCVMADGAVLSTV